MDAQTILKTVLAITAQTEAIAAQFEAAKDVMTSEDAGEIQAALGRLQAANDTLHERVTNKLKAAAQR